MNPNKKVLLIDRYDMMYGEYTNEIAEYSKHAIVIIDCKRDIRFTNDDKLCYITMTANSITVEE